VSDHVGYDRNDVPIYAGNWVCFVQEATAVRELYVPLLVVPENSGVCDIPHNKTEREWAAFVDVYDEGMDENSWDWEGHSAWTFGGCYKHKKVVITQNREGESESSIDAYRFGRVIEV
jgi:hypothetical protein